MKWGVLCAHNYYRARGGEDVAFEGEAELLAARGHQVLRFEVSSRAIVGLKGRGRAAMDALWSRRTYREIGRMARTRGVAVAHFHNTFPLISPAAYAACRDAGLIVVQTLHNYRRMCPRATLFRAGRPCEACVGRFPWPGILHRCYHDSIAETSMVAIAGWTHTHLARMTQDVDLYIALSQFSRRKFIEGGLPEDRVVVRPNYVSRDPGGRVGTGDYALYVGRLSEEKGVRVLMDAWARLPDIPLRIVGEGPLGTECRRRIAESGMRNVTLVGRVDRESVWDQIKGARFVVCPSICYENFPMAVAEAFACGVPVVGSALGAIGELIEPGITGITVNPGDGERLAVAVSDLWGHPQLSERMGDTARARYLSDSRADRAYTSLLEIYAHAGCR